MKTILIVAIAGLASLAACSRSPEPGSSPKAIQAGSEAQADPGPPLETKVPNEAADTAHRIACVNNMKQLGLAFRIWATDNGDLLPPSILAMSNEVASTKMLVCPADTSRQPAKDWASATATNVSYQLLTPSAKLTGGQQTVLLCPLHGNVTLGDGNVRQGPGKTEDLAAQSLLAHLQTARQVSTRVEYPRVNTPTPGTPGVPSQPGLRSFEKSKDPNTESEALKRDLKDKDPKVRRVAIEKLARGLSEGAQVRLTPRKELLDKLEATQKEWAGLLAESLTDQDEQVRMGAASALSMCGSAAQVALPQLTKALQGSNQPLKGIAARTLGNLGTNAAVAIPALKEMLNAPGQLRFTAAQALWKITKDAPLVMPALIEALEIKGTNYVDSWPSVFASGTLAEMGPDAKAAVPALTRLLEAKDQKARVAAAAAMVRISPDTPGIAEVLGAGLQQDASLSNMAAQKALCALGPKSVPVLVKAADDPSPVVRRLAIETLGACGTQAADTAVPFLAGKPLEDSDEFVRRAAAEALGKIAAQANAAVPPLRTALKDKSSTVRSTAAAALVRVDPPANDAVLVLLEAISREVGETAYITACNAASEISPAAIPVVLEFLQTAAAPGAPGRDLPKRYRLRDGAIDLLGRMGPNAKAAVPALIGIFEDKQRPFRRGVAQSLGLIGPDAEAAVPCLTGALQDEDVWVRLNSAVALAWIDRQDESHILFLNQFLKHQDPSVRATTARCLGDMGPRARSVVPALRQLARDENDESVLREVTRSLEAIEADRLPHTDNVGR